MSIATQISALQADKTDIANAIIAMGGTMGDGDGFDDFATAIATIPTRPSDYTGITTVTPTQSTQTLATAGKVVPSNITVNPIPSNYGKVTWSGGIITIT